MKLTIKALTGVALTMALSLIMNNSVAADAAERAHGLVGLRPLPRTVADHKSNHGGSWAGTPTSYAQKGPERDGIPDFRTLHG